MHIGIKTLLAASTGLLAILSWNTLTLQSDQTGSGQQATLSSQHLPAVDEAALATLLSEAIRFKTLSFDDGRRDQAAFNGFRQWLASRFPRVHQSLTLQLLNEHTLLFHWRGQAATAPVLWSAHYDVVPVIPGTEKQWQHPPFAGAVADGYVWGRGALDDKSAVVTMLSAIETQLAAGLVPGQDVWLALTHDEEVGSLQGAKAVDAYLQQQGVNISWSLDEGSYVLDGLIPGATAPVASINVAEKGYLTLELTAKAAGGHSSMPPTDTAVTILARALTRLQQAPMPGGLDGVSADFYQSLAPVLPLAQRALLANSWLFGPLLSREISKSPAGNAMLRTTTAPTMLSGSIKSNVLPIEARAVVNFRIHPRDSIADVIAHVRNVTGEPALDIQQIDGNEASKVAASDNDAFALLAAATRAVYGEMLVVPGLTLGATDSRFYGGAVQHSYRFNPMVLTNEDLAGFHGTNERISSRNLAQAVRFYQLVLTQL